MHFEDAERNPEPALLDKTVPWEEVKRFFTTHARDFIEAFRHIIM